ncbi:hypothetical protein Taro_014777 [Colocasia esculenta]|uniref:Uncharacterized protein n=1 Tax=Colocasia esculenta TaxID=4460 RepID=A0A843UK47_COLES|nr:hypothetical protein [Colocasia esculenta]
MSGCRGVPEGRILVAVWAAVVLKLSVVVPAAARAKLGSASWSEEVAAVVSVFRYLVDDPFGGFRKGCRACLCLLGFAYGETFLLTWLLGVSRGDTWLFLPDLVEVRAEGCFRNVFDSTDSAGVVYGPTLVVGRGITLFHCFFLLLWLVRDWLSLLSLVCEAHPPTLFRRVLLLLLGARAASVVAIFTHAAVGFVLGLRIRVVVSCSRSSSLLVLVEVRFPQNCVVLVFGCCGITLWVELVVVALASKLRIIALVEGSGPVWSVVPFLGLRFLACGFWVVVVTTGKSCGSLFHIQPWSVVAPAAAHAEIGAVSWSEEVTVVLSPCSPPRGCVDVLCVAIRGCSFPAVYLPSDVATAVRVATSEEASLWALVSVALPVAMISRRARRARQHKACLGCFYGLIGVAACAPGYANFCDGCPACSLSPGALHLRACPVQRLSLFPGTPILGSLLREFSGLRACSSLQPSVADSRAEGKMVVGSGVDFLSRRVRAEGCFRIVFDSAGSAGVVSGRTLVVGHGITLFRCFVVLCSRLFGHCGLRIRTQSAYWFSVCERDGGECRILNAIVQDVAFMLPLFVVVWLHAHHMACAGQSAGVSGEKAMIYTVAFLSRLPVRWHALRMKNVVFAWFVVWALWAANFDPKRLLVLYLERDGGECRILNATVQNVVFTLPLFEVVYLHARRVAHAG